MTRHTRSVLFTVPLLVLALATGACGGDSTGEEQAGGGNATQASDHEKQLAFAKCMRENGITDFPDPPAEGAPRQAPKLPKPGEAGYEAAIDRYQKAAEKCGVSGGAVMPAQPVR